MFVTAMLPPGNIQAEFEKVKERMFVEYGMASVYALPSIVPLCCSDTEPRSPALHSVLRQTRAIGVETVVSESGVVYAPLPEPEVVGEVLDQLDTRAEDAAKPIFRCVAGVIIGFHEEERIADRTRFSDFLSSLLSAKAISFARAEIVCIELRPAGVAKWWEQSSLRYVWRRPLKLPRQRSDRSRLKHT